MEKHMPLHPLFGNLKHFFESSKNARIVFMILENLDRPAKAKVSKVNKTESL